jgi:predicted nucleic acid-binding Zn ribbon protein
VKTARRPRAKVATRAGELVRSVLTRYGVEGALREHRLVTEWDKIVGARVAARAWPDGLRHGVLYVRVTNSAWLHELAFLREALVREANKIVGDPPLVKEVRLHLGDRRSSQDAEDLVAALAGQKRPKLAARPRLAPASAAQLARIDVEADRVRDAELREIIRDVRRRLGL